MIKLLLTCSLFAYTFAVAHHGPPHVGPGYHVPHAPPPPPPPHLGPKYHPGPKYAPSPYSYSYGVKDEYHGVNFGQNEDSDGKVVTGTYHVLLPDGRVQNVKYTADHYTGYVADVAYDSPAKPYHPPVHAKPAPYHPPPPIHHGPHNG
jgi:hypothetical protein